MKANVDGCALCGSTWGAIWHEVDGERLFFCCEVCADQFRLLVERVKAHTGWPRIDSLQITGDRRGRSVTASHGGGISRFFISFNPQGAVHRFTERTGPEE